MKTWLMLALMVSTGALGEAPPAGQTFKALGKVIIGWPANSNSGAFEESGRAEFCNTLMKVLESDEMSHRAQERVSALHPKVAKVPVAAKAQRVKDTAIIELTATGGEATYVRFYIDALLDETMAFYLEMAEKAGGPTINKIIEEVLSREKEVKKKDQERQAFLKAHAKDLDEHANQKVLDRLEAEFKRADEGYQSWLKALTGLEQFMVTSIPRVAVIERPQAAVLVP